MDYGMGSSEIFPVSIIPWMFRFQWIGFVGKNDGFLDIFPTILLVSAPLNWGNHHGKSGEDFPIRDGMIQTSLG
jgi:hypothetical protein